MARSIALHLGVLMAVRGSIPLSTLVVPLKQKDSTHVT